MKYNWKLFFESAEGKIVLDKYDFSSFDKSKIENILEDNVDNLNVDPVFGFERLVLLYNEIFRLYKVLESHYTSIRQFFESTVDSLNEFVKRNTIYVGDTKDYQELATDIPLISLILTLMIGDSFYPILFVRNFPEFQQRCEILGIKLPLPPKEKDRRDRCLYYADICEAIEIFRIENSLNRNEVIALIYGYAANISIEINESKEHLPLPLPSHIYICGAARNGEGDYEVLENAEEVEWQGGKRAKAGDICVVFAHMKNNPHFHSVWRMLSDTIYNPFDFHCYRIKLGYKVPVPKVSLKEANHDPEASQIGLIKGNVRGLDGNKEVHLKDYEILKRLFLQKDPDYNLSSLPNVEGVVFDEEFEGKEKEVTLKYLEEKLLPSLGYNDSDWVKELQLRLGRTIVEDERQSKKGRPDVTILYKDLGLDQKYAPFVIEVKLDFDKEDFLDVLKQGVSYARMLHSRFMAVCDKKRFVLFKRKGKYFKESDIVFDHYWKELKDPQLKQQLYDFIGKPNIVGLRE